MRRIPAVASLYDSELLENDYKTTHKPAEISLPIHSLFQLSSTQNEQSSNFDQGNSAARSACE